MTTRDGYVYRLREVEGIREGAITRTTRLIETRHYDTDVQAMRRYATHRLARDEILTVTLQRRSEPAEWENVDFLQSDPEARP